MAGRAGLLCRLVLIAALAGCAASSEQPDDQPADTGAAARASTSATLVPDSVRLRAAERASAVDLEPAADFPAFGVTATRAQVEVRSSPDGPVVHTLANPLPSGAPLTFLLDSREGDWLKVMLPVRPNGSTGWIRAEDGEMLGLPYRIDVSRGQHEVRLYRLGELVKTYPVGIGTEDTPTPGGTFYLKELLSPTNQGGEYGPYAYGLSGFSDALSSFAGGEAVIGLHGTNQPDSIGTDVSSGCIRMRNEDITALAELLPLGTPVRILA